MGKKKITINEIAERSGVSIATVSRILNQKNNVKPQTKQYVMDIIAQLEKEHGYEGHFSSPKNGSVILLVAEFNSPVLNDFAAGIQRAASSSGYHVITLDYSRYRIDLLSEINYLAQIISISGIIMLNNYEQASDIETLASHFPVVTAFTGSSSPKVGSIAIDNYLAGQTLANYVLSLNCKEIAVFAINDTFTFSKLRKNGIVDSLSQSGLNLPSYNLIELPGFDFGVATSMIRQRLQLHIKPDAIICINDALAAISIRELRKFGYQVPQDVIVTGFDNAEISTLVEPNLTTINQNPFQIGSQALNMLINMMENPDASAQHINLKGELIVRESTLR